MRLIRALTDVCLSVRTRWQYSRHHPASLITLQLTFTLGHIVLLQLFITL